jgi:hypothetical protein
MKRYLLTLPVAGLALTLTLRTAAPVAADPPAPGAPPPPAQVGMDVLARGPVHEAFAQFVGGVPPEPTPIVPKEPPPPLPEEPPDTRPEGDNVQWIGGYWAWDADSNQFIWVSGTYRNAPPGRTYVPGYWENTADGWRWVPGFWGPDSQPEAPYLPEPPAPLDPNGPTTPPPDDNSFYVPGNWDYQQTRYAWRPGFWSRCRPGFVWTPTHYCWTPAGHVCVPGYWDYPLDDRGLLFAPVAFTQPLWQTPGWCYRPGFVVGTGALLNSFFIHPRWGYHYGDYYGARFASRGFHPWFSYGARYRDPLFGYYRWQNRGNPGWQAGLRQTYLDRVAGRAPLPPRTLVQQNALLRRTTVNQTVVNNNLRVVTPLNQFRTTNNVRLTNVPAAQRTVQRNNAARIQQFAAARSRSERALVGRAPVRGSGPASRPVASLKLPGRVGGTRTVVAPRTQPGVRPGATLPGQGARPPVSGNGSPRFVNPQAKAPVVQPRTTAPRTPAVATRPPTVQQRPTSPAVRSQAAPRVTNPPRSPAAAPRQPAVQRPTSPSPRPQVTPQPTRPPRAPAAAPRAPTVQRRAASPPPRVTAPRPQAARSQSFAPARSQAAAPRAASPRPAPSRPPQVARPQPQRAAPARSAPSAARNQGDRPTKR